MRWTLVALLAALSASGGSAYNFFTDADPVANPEAVVQVPGDRARFTVLTDRVVRMEWGTHTDSATFAFVNRKLPVPSFDHHVDAAAQTLHLNTSFVRIEYRLNSGKTFDDSNLKVSAVDSEGVWQPWAGLKGAQRMTQGNLFGTVRTLDGVDGATELDCAKQQDGQQHCAYGPLSRSGLAVLDDSQRPQFTKTEGREAPWLHIPSKPSGPDGEFDPALLARLNKECPNVPMHERQECGYRGIEELDCTGRGCCYAGSGFNEEQHDAPRCYFSPSSNRDYYVFGQGDLDYPAVLNDYQLIAGRQPLPPRFTFGVWWSRYWSYSESGLREIVEQYEQRGLPLDTFVIDMDWHPSFDKERNHGAKDQSGQGKGWTGYTWNSDLFSNAPAFLAWLRDSGLHATCNLHPASGIQPWEDTYEEVARASGIDPASQKFVPFRPADRQAVEVWTNITLARRESEGVDFWWLDWQQGERYMRIPDVNPTFWLNHLFFTKPIYSHDALPAPGSKAVEDPSRRPMLFHRWGGLGNHRYQIGFSGDVHTTWKSLDFQVKFTATASNVLYGLWSHDIGGHIQRPTDEMYVRWVQWGVYSPVFRTHSSKNHENDRRIWRYPPTHYQAMRDAFVVRAQLVPYLYSAARDAHLTGVSLMRPMYYEFPKAKEAYADAFGSQYLLGDSLLVAPVTSPAAQPSDLARKSVWIPAGMSAYSLDWGVVLEGPVVADLDFALWEVPVFQRLGRPVGRAGDSMTVSKDGRKYTRSSIGRARELPDVLRFDFVAAGLAGNVPDFSPGVYEDDGTTLGYLSGHHGWTNVTFSPNQEGFAAVVLPPGAQLDDPNGELPSFFPATRQYEIRVQSVWPAKKVALLVTSSRKGDPRETRTELPYAPLGSACQKDCWQYDGASLTLIVKVVEPKSMYNMVTAAATTIAPMLHPLLRAGFPKAVKRAARVKAMMDEMYMGTNVYCEDYPSLLQLSELGNKLSYTPADAVETVTLALTKLLPQARAEFERLADMDWNTKQRMLALLGDPLQGTGQDSSKLLKAFNGLLKAGQVEDAHKPQNAVQQTWFAKKLFRQPPKAIVQ